MSNGNDERPSAELVEKLEAMGYALESSPGGGFSFRPGPDVLQRKRQEWADLARRMAALGPASSPLDP